MAVNRDTVIVFVENLKGGGGYRDVPELIASGSSYGSGPGLIYREVLSRRFISGRDCYMERLRVPIFKAA